MTYQMKVGIFPGAKSARWCFHTDRIQFPLWTSGQCNQVPAHDTVFARAIVFRGLKVSGINKASVLCNSTFDACLRLSRCASGSAFHACRIREIPVQSLARCTTPKEIGSLHISTNTMRCLAPMSQTKSSALMRRQPQVILLRLIIALSMSLPS